MARTAEFQQRIADQVRRLRQERGLSQADLVERLAGTGLGWHQQTVAKVERGARPLRLEEAVALASVLGVDITRLYEEGPDGDLRREYRELRNRLLVARRDLEGTRRQADASRAMTAAHEAHHASLRREYESLMAQVSAARQALEGLDDGEPGEED